MSNSTQFLEGEQWRPVVGYEGLYSVSSHGRIRDEIDRNRYRAGRIRAGCPNADGYLRISLTKDFKRKKWFVHKLVAEAFIGLPVDGMEVNHIDGVKTNNRLDNLEYRTHQGNMRHACDNDLWNPAVRFGVDHPLAKLTPDKVRAMRAEYAEGHISYPKLAEKYGVTCYATQQAVKRQTWKHVD